MIRIKGKRKRKRFPINVLPLVDIIFQLLVFFLLTSTFLSQKAMKMQLPASATASTPASSGIVLTLRRDGAIFLNRKPVSEQELQGRLQEELKKRQEVKISLQADRRVALQKVVSVLDLLQETGVENFELMTVGKVEQ